MQLIDGKKRANEIFNDLKSEIKKLKEQDINPTLAIILVGSNPSSEIYVRNKMARCEEIGITALLKSYPEDVGTEELIEEIKSLNEDNQVHGILVQCPLPAPLDETAILNTIDPQKDVDGFTSLNMGRLLSKQKSVLAATPRGIMDLLASQNIAVAGKNVVIIGRSNIVGRPLAIALLNKDATVTIAHSKTQDLKKVTREADIIVVAVGQAQMITADYLKDGAVVIDVGINRVAGKVVGDVDANSVAAKAAYLTPVPGGVGPMTVAMLLKNLVDLAQK